MRRPYENNRRPLGPFKSKIRDPKSKMRPVLHMAGFVAMMGAMLGGETILAAVDESTRWMLITVAALTLIYAVIRPRLRKKDPLDEPPRFSSLAQQRGVEREMSNLLVELSEMSRQISAQLDTRAAKLDLLIREADEKIAALKGLSGGSAVESPRPPAMRLVQPPVEVDRRDAEIYALADRGQPASEIARQLNRPAGEVELILALRANR